jgi:capsular polysaccharide biosynthesis protein
MYYTLPEPQDFTAIEEMRKFFEQYRIPTTDKKIYISRKNFDRGFSNEKQIESYMKSLGYEICYPENLNPIDQYKLYVSSKEIVCLIGSSIVNALLCTDSSTVKIIGHEDPNDPNMFSSMSRVWTDFLNKFEIPNSIYEIPKDYDDEKIDKFLKDNFK